MHPHLGLTFMGSALGCPSCSSHEVRIAPSRDVIKRKRTIVARVVNVSGCICKDNVSSTDLWHRGDAVVQSSR